ncbi:uncharacterized protein SPAPADRAFT_58761 [Spathaspora passalidarum NRRL Y-27907]|uniref:Uncharacterized protein n=1 Tax=Spathaspora passalidarum (strain NRRL Y-27907 / 11-Y1) TaxID=619300 RepID=G3AHA6_SPAPN|nr:uncharacterized protein SPAPADRAFT_58761 [Spathaspora passalidarum NRRL Y-27907]EGW35536.1 hypothetical protein SPAPADRAFT_58761 [Spathaspora passalidarum NRRL Y-27907]
MNRILSTRTTTLPRTIRNYSVRIPQQESIPQNKPRLSQFTTAMTHTFLFAGIAYMGLQAIWLHLEYEQAEGDLTAKSKSLEEKIQSIVDSKKEELIQVQQTNSKRWYKFW